MKWTCLYSALFSLMHNSHPIPSPVVARVCGFRIEKLLKEGSLSVFGALLLYCGPWFSCGTLDPPPPPFEDTTSHNFVWTVSIVGDGGNNILRDVVIIDDTLAVAVGNLSLRDSLGGLGSDYYNLFIWKEDRWRGNRVQFFTVCGQTARFPYPAGSIFSLGSTDIWVAMDGDQIARWNGTTQTSTTCIPVVGVRLWGHDSAAMYAVGEGGALAYFNGITWQGFSSGIAATIRDVHGSPDGSAIWACGYWQSQIGTYLWRLNGAQAFLLYDGTRYASAIRKDSLSGTIGSVFAPSADRLFIASNAGVYEVSPLTRGEGRRIALSGDWLPGFPNKIRGNAANDWFVVGTSGFVAHYNGSTLRHYPQLTNDNCNLLSVAQHGNIVIAVGYDYDPFNQKAVVIVGRRP